VGQGRAPSFFLHCVRPVLTPSDHVRVAVQVFVRFGTVLKMVRFSKNDIPCYLVQFAAPAEADNARKVC
jgi:hypothetical protein